jgi:hypothetical protein
MPGLSLSQAAHEYCAGLGSPGIPDDNNEARTLCERRQRSRAAGSQQTAEQQSKAGAPDAKFDGRLPSYLTLPYLERKERKKEKSYY